MPSKPIDPPSPRPKRVAGVVRDELPVDDYRHALDQKEKEMAQQNRRPSPPNVAAARRETRDEIDQSKKEHDNTTGSKYRSTTRH